MENTMVKKDIGQELMELMVHGAERNPEKPWVKLGLASESEWNERRNSEKAVNLESKIESFTAIKHVDGIPVKMKDRLKMTYLGKSEWTCFDLEVNTAWAKHHDSVKLNKETWNQIYNHIRKAYKCVARVTGNPDYLAISREQVKQMFELVKGYTARDICVNGVMYTQYDESTTTALVNVISTDIRHIKVGAPRFECKTSEKVTAKCIDDKGVGYTRGTLDESDD